MTRFHPEHAADVAAPTAHVILETLAGTVVSTADPDQFQDVAERVYTAIQVYVELAAARKAALESSIN